MENGGRREGSGRSSKVMVKSSREGGGAGEEMIERVNGRGGVGRERRRREASELLDHGTEVGSVSGEDGGGGSS